MVTAIKHPVPDRVKPSFVIFDSHERQSTWMSKITSDSLTRSGTGCFVNSCIHMAIVGVRGLKTDRTFAETLGALDPPASVT